MSARELAISAVPFDAVLVTELSERLAPRLGSTQWLALSLSEDASARDAATSRLALVLHQRLWGHDTATKSDEAALQQRMHRRPESIRVVTLDATPLPEWLACAPQCSLSAVGLDGVVECVVQDIIASGGSAQRTPAPVTAAPSPTRSDDEGRAFLLQPRAYSSLRRELDAIGEELRLRMDDSNDHGFDPEAKLDTIPHRLVVQLGGVAVSFSWVSGRTDRVADGRLLVIEWEGTVALRRGLGSGRTATPVRESVYRAEASGAEAWQWRADDSHGRAFSTANLVGEWFVGASIAVQPHGPVAASTSSEGTAL